MKQELYHYAISLKEKNLSNIPIPCLWILLSILLIPIIISKVIIGLVLLFAYLILHVFSQKGNNKYNRELLILGVFLLFLGFEFAALILIQYDITISLIVTVLSMLIAYETIFLIKVKKKLYSHAPKSWNTWINIVPWIFGTTGVWAGKLIAKIEDTGLKTWIMVFVCASLFVYSFTFFQKYFIHKKYN